MPEVLQRMITAAIGRRYLDMLPVLVCCDCAEENGYAGVSAVVRLRFYAERVAEYAATPLQNSISKRIQMWSDNDEINHILHELRMLG